MKAAFKILLRVGITALLLFLVLHKVDFDKILHILRNANMGFLWAAFFCNILLFLLCAMRWHYLLLDHGIKVNYFHTVLYYLIGFFYNNFLPTVIGGGVVRAFYAGKRNNKTKQAFSSMLVETIIGGWTLILYSIVMAVLWLSGHRKIILSILVIFIGATIAIFLFFERRFMGKFRGIVEKIKVFNLGEQLKELYNEMYFYKTKKGSIIKVIIISFGMQSLLGVMNFFIGLALGFKIPFMSYMVYPAIIGVITALPITINGLGLREWGYKVFFHFNGLSGEQAITLSLVFWFIGVIASFLGAIAFLFVKFEKQQEK
ncbi:MAG: lysylphosphatidylglycerol synthase transmembrane domain-containing protein [bacterium]|nr:lysylphosphatidylglycerol synthase transmembrane domain-containing protein [bacterium]